MASRHVTYQFDWGFGTYDRNTEQDRIDEIELKNKYLDKWDVSIPERELIDNPETELIVQEGELILRTEEVEVIV